MGVAGGRGLQRDMRKPLGLMDTFIIDTGDSFTGIHT